MTSEETLQVFRQSGALLEGHFVLRSGLHSRQYFQCALALQEMPIVERLGAALADQVRGLGATTVKRSESDSASRTSRIRPHMTARIPFCRI